MKLSPVRIALLGVLVALAGTASSDPPTTPINTWGTGQAVRAVARAGDRLFVGGAFSSVYPTSRFTGALATFQHGSEQAVSLPGISGQSVNVTAIADDGAGGWFAGGVFARAGSLAFDPQRPQVVHLRADGTAVPLVIQPPSGSDPLVKALARSGTTLFVAYVTYTYVGRIVFMTDHLAAFDVVTDAQRGAGIAIGGFITAMVADDTRVYVFGIQSIAGTSRPGAGAIDTATLTVAPWTTPVAPVRIAEIDGTTLYVEGGVLSGGAQGFAAISTVDGSQLAWAPSPSQPPRIVTAIAAGPGAVYIADSVAPAGFPSTITAVDKISGAPIGWSAAVDGSVSALDAVGSRLYAGGRFSMVAGEPRVNLAAFTAGVLDPWNPRPSDEVGELASTADRIAVGGRLTGLAAIPRPGLAEFHAGTGEVTSWTPAGITRAEISTLATDGRWLFAGGFLEGTFGGCNPFCTALAIALDGSASISLSAADMRSISVAGSRLYLAGPFGLIGFDLRTGTQLPWTGAGQIRKILATDAAVYAVPFEPGTSTGGHVWKFDAQSGQQLAWGPVTTVLPVGELAVSGSMLLVGLGTTSTSGSVLLAVDQATGAVLAEAPRTLVPTIDYYPPPAPFSPLLNPPPWAPAWAGLAASPHGILLSNNGTLMGLQPNGATLPWTVTLDGPAPTLYADDRVVVAGGGFATAGGVVSPGVAIFADRVAAAPANLAAAVNGRNVQFTWTAPALGNVREYRLEAGSTPGAADLAVLTLPPTPPSYLATGVPDGRYFVRVRVVNGAGAGPPSNEVEVIVGLPPPLAPTGFAAAVNGRTVALSWTAVAGQVDQYVLDVGSAPGLSNLVRGASLGLTTGATFNNVPPGTYYARLRALNRTGSSPPSAEVVITVQ